VKRMAKGKKKRFPDHFQGGLGQWRIKTGLRKKPPEGKNDPDDVWKGSQYWGQGVGKTMEKAEARLPVWRAQLGGVMGRRRWNPNITMSGSRSLGSGQS